MQVGHMKAIHASLSQSRACGTYTRANDVLIVSLEVGPSGKQCCLPATLLPCLSLTPFLARILKDRFTQAVLCAG